MLLDIHNSWNPVLHHLWEEPLLTLKNTIFPSISFQPRKENIFRVFRTPVNNIKVVILGQDPYPAPNLAVGLSFAVSSHSKMPVSLRNIRKEIEDEGFILSDSEEWKTLEHWEKQGIFLLNTALTVETGKAASHIPYWNNFIKDVITFISLKNPCIWVLWGRYAQSFLPFIRHHFNVDGYTGNLIKDVPIKDKINYILTAVHPAAEAYKKKAGFFGCNHFININEIIKKQNINRVINF